MLLKTSAPILQRVQACPKILCRKFIPWKISLEIRSSYEGPLRLLISLKIVSQLLAPGLTTSRHSRGGDWGHEHEQFGAHVMMLRRYGKWHGFGILGQLQISTVKIILCFTGWLVIQVILFSGGPITGCPEVKHIEAKTDAKARLSEMRVLIPVTPDQIGMRFHAGSQLLILYLHVFAHDLAAFEVPELSLLHMDTVVARGLGRRTFGFLWIGSRTKVPC